MQAKQAAFPPSRRREKSYSNYAYYSTAAAESQGNAENTAFRGLVMGIKKRTLKAGMLAFKPEAFRFIQFPVACF